MPTWQFTSLSNTFLTLGPPLSRLLHLLPLWLWGLLCYVLGRLWQIYGMHTTEGCFIESSEKLAKLVILFIPTAACQSNHFLSTWLLFWFGFLVF